MSCDVYANGDEIACKVGDNHVIAAMPDVCLSPPSPPAGPVPVPYPNTSFSKDMQNGSKTVLIGDQEVMLKDQSFYKTSPLGDEAATNGLGAGVITHVITGKTYCAAWSMDVQFEGQNVDRHTDLTTSNHASPTTNGATGPTVSKSAKPPPGAKCPCCNKDVHANQWDPDTGEVYKEVDEMEFYKEGLAFRQQGVSPEAIAQFKADTAGKLSPEQQEALIDTHKEYLKNSENAYKTLEEARKKDPLCPNLHKPGDKCGKHLRKTNPEPKTSTPKDRKKLGFTDGVRNDCLVRYPNKPDGTPIPEKNDKGEGPKICHKTPLNAGGCPSSQDNLIPKDALTPECQAVDEAQDTLQNDRATGLKKGRS
jgi:hypothetical protein